MHFELVILFLIALRVTTIRCAHEHDYGVDFERLEFIPGTTRSLYQIYAKLVRIDRGSEVCVWGNISFTEDFGNDHKISATTAISSNGGVNFVPTIYKIPPKNYCQFTNTTWRDFIAPTVKDVSTLPEIPPGGLCPFPKGSYELNCVKIVIHDNWPNHIPPGLLKITYKHTKNNEFVGGANAYVNIYKK